MKHFLLCFSYLLFLSSCKEPDEIGLQQVTKQKLNVRYTDTTKIYAYSVKEDSIITNSTIINILGKIDDPIFGKTTAGFYTQFQLASTNLSFGTSPVLDSMVITLAYSGSYGDNTKQQTVNVYELTEDLDISKSYYSIDKKTFNPVKVGTKTFIPRPTDSLTVDSVKYAPHLRINLDPAFANKFITADPTDLTNNTNFVKFFKGLYITADSNSEANSLLYFNLLSSLTQIRIYYHNTEISNTYIYFYINTLCPRFNSFNHHNYSTSEANFKKQIISKDTLLGNQTLYLQATGGIKTKILTDKKSLSDLYSLAANENIAINKAELVIKPDISLSGDTSIYKVPLQLTIVRLTKDDKTLLPADYYVGSEYFGGYYDKKKNEYRFNLSLYMQDLINNRITDDKCLYLLVDAASANAGRLVFSGNKNPNIDFPNNFRLEITYTKLGIKNK